MLFYFDNTSYIKIKHAQTDSTDSKERETRVALMLAALGNESRLRIYRLLIRAGRNGSNVGDLQEQLDIPASTLSHHIAALRHAELITQRRQGRAIISFANYANMDELIGYLSEECCADENDGKSP